MQAYIIDYRCVINTVFSLSWSFFGNFVKQNPKIFYNLSKCSIVYFIFDLHDNDIQYIFHHLSAILLSSIVIWSQNTDINYVFFMKFVEIEYSTFLLNLYYLTKYPLIKYLFASTFLYYRTYRFTNWLLIDKTKYFEFNLICSNHKLYSHTSCILIASSGIILIGLLNLMWGYMICQKLYNEFNKFHPVILRKIDLLI